MTTSTETQIRTHTGRGARWGWPAAVVAAILGGWLAFAAVFVWIETITLKGPPVEWTLTAAAAADDLQPPLPDLVRLRTVTNDPSIPGCAAPRSTVWSMHGSTDAYAVLTVVICPTLEEAAAVVSNTNGSANSGGPPITFRGQAIPELGRPDLRFRIWSNGAAIYQTSMLCRDDRPCSSELVSITQTLMAALPPIGLFGSAVGVSGTRR